MRCCGELVFVTCVAGGVKLPAMLCSHRARWPDGHTRGPTVQSALQEVSGQ